MTLKRGRNIKHPPYAFTQEGVAMLSGILRSPEAVKVNVAIMRAFVRLRQGLTIRRELLKRLVNVEKRVGLHDEELSELRALFDGLSGGEDENERRIGFSP